MNIDELKARPVEELRDLAAKYSIPVHGNMKPEKIAMMIAEHATNPNVASLETKKIEVVPTPIAEKKVAILNTEEQVRETIKHCLEKDGFVVEFTEQNWYFKYRGAEECGHMTVPLRIIKQKAESVAKGARRLMGMKDFDSLPGVKPNSAYTNAVISA